MENLEYLKSVFNRICIPISMRPKITNELIRLDKQKQLVIYIRIGFGFRQKKRWKCFFFFWFSTNYLVRLSTIKKKNLFFFVVFWCETHLTVNIRTWVDKNMYTLRVCACRLVSVQIQFNVFSQCAYLQHLSIIETYNMDVNVNINNEFCT